MMFRNVAPIIFTPKPKFEEYAYSLRAMDGGNPKGRLWFCGIEPGGGGDLDYIVNGKPYLKERDDKTAHPAWTDEFKEDHSKGEQPYWTWRYNQFVAKITVAALDREFESWRDYVRKELYTLKGDTYKFNLYPMSFERHDNEFWTKESTDFTGFPNKIIYKAWCMQNYFPMLRALVEKYSPKALICTGTKLRFQFRFAFGSLNKVYDEQHYSRTKIGKHDIEYFQMQPGGTFVFIAPFLGQGGILANGDFAALGQFVSEISF